MPGMLWASTAKLLWQGKVKKGSVRQQTAVLGGDNRDPTDLTRKEQGEKRGTRSRQSALPDVTGAGSGCAVAEGASALCSKAASLALQGHRGGPPSCSGTWFLPGRAALCPAWAARPLLRLAAGKDVGAPGGCPSPRSRSPPVSSIPPRQRQLVTLARGAQRPAPLPAGPRAPATPAGPHPAPPRAAARPAEGGCQCRCPSSRATAWCRCRPGTAGALLDATACVARLRCQYRSGRAADGCHFCPRCQEPLLVPLGPSLVPALAPPRPRVPAPALIFTHTHRNTCTPQHGPPHADRAQHTPLPPSSHGAPEVVRSGGCSDSENSLTHIQLPTHLHIHTCIPQHQPPLSCPWCPGKLQGFLGTSAGTLGRVWMALRECPGRKQLLEDTHKHVFQTLSSHRVMAGLLPAPLLRGIFTAIRLPSLPLWLLWCVVGRCSIQSDSATGEGCTVCSK
ncbi:uncharacterized protein LOC120410812 [Corvus cornix cornix]|uniref:uncharacterized protein LOC120410812 n=1 Tax=Corvus cornix cornix TaxID=932674 RepID=UPI00194F7825|nr:uncharacterized protein LOC120410812 [Corvus cornix cornix]